MEPNSQDVVITRLTCLRCGHSWLPRVESMPLLCPKCKNPYWNKPRKLPKRDDHQEFRP